MSNPFQGHAGVPALAGQPQGMVPAGFGGFGNSGGLMVPQNSGPMVVSSRPSVAVEEIDFGSDVKTSTLDKFPKMKKDEIAKIAFLLFAENGNPKLKLTKYFTVGKYPDSTSFAAPIHNPDLMKALVKALGEPKLRFGTIIMQYATDSYGNFTNPPNYKLFAYIFGVDKWNILRPLHNSWNLSGYDLQIMCQEENYQKVLFQPLPHNIWRTGPEEMQADIQGRAQELYDNSLLRLMGFAKSDQEIVTWIQTGRWPDANVASGAPQQNYQPSLSPFAGGGAQVLPGPQGFGMPQGGAPQGFGMPQGGPQPSQPGFGGGMSPGGIAAQAGVGDPRAMDFSTLVAQATQAAPAPAAGVEQAPPTAPEQPAPGTPQGASFGSVPV